MVRLLLGPVCALGLLLAMPQAAAGGGWWSSIQFERAPVAPGQRVELHADVLLSAEQEADRFSVYLLRGFDDSVLERAMRKRSPGDWWSLGAAEAMPVGQVSITDRQMNFGRATAAFTVPEIQPGTYHLMLCDTGCREPLADVIPAAGFTVVADPATARMAKHVERLERRIRDQGRQLAAARTAVDEAFLEARDARSEVEAVEARASAPVAARSNTPAKYAGWLVAAALAAALALTVLRRGQSRTRRAANSA